MTGQARSEPAHQQVAYEDRGRETNRSAEIGNSYVTYGDGIQ